MTRGIDMAKVIAIDSETTGLHPERRIWDLAMVVPGRVGSYQWFIDVADLDLGHADPFALRIGKFYDRHPQMGGATAKTHREVDVLRQVERLTRGAHLLGAVPNFDADVLDRRMRAHGILPSWHYHLIDIEAMAVGFLLGVGRVSEVSVPWKSDELSECCMVEQPSEEERHTALGDAQWAKRWYEAITGGKP